MARSIDWAARMFQALVMLFVVAGHAHSGGFDGPFQLFPVASFHVAGFSFVSGYLYSDRHDPSPGPFILARVRRLLVPMLAIYGVYGLVTVALDAVFGFSFRGGVSPTSILLASFFAIGQFDLCNPMWFIAPFFLSESVWVLMRFALRGLRARREALPLALCLLLGCVAIVAGGGDGVPAGWPILVTRTLFMMPWLALGRWYGLAGDRLRAVPTPLFLLAVVLCKAAVCYTCSGSGAYAQYACRFPDGVAGTYLSTVLGIAFWWRVCEVASRRLGEASRRVVSAVGGSTFSIMCHHVTGFFLVNCLYCLAHAQASLFGRFDVASFRSQVFYQYLPHGIPQASVVYVVAGIALPLVVHRLYLQIESLVVSRARRLTGGVG